MKAGVDLVDSKVTFGKGQELKSNLGLNVDTGFEAGVGSVSGSVAGVGATLGRTVGIKTPIGGFSLKLW